MRVSCRSGNCCVLLCFEKCRGVGLHWCGLRRYHPAPSGHIKVSLAEAEITEALFPIQYGQVVLQIKFLRLWVVIYLKQTRWNPSLLYLKCTWTVVFGLNLLHYSSCFCPRNVFISFSGRNTHVTSLLLDINSPNCTPVKLCVCDFQTGQSMTRKTNPDY